MTCSECNDTGVVEVTCHEYECFEDGDCSCPGFLAQLPCTCEAAGDFAMEYTDDDIPF